MIKKDFSGMSLRGLTAYGISCLNIYVKNKYPTKDFTKVLDKACQITEDGAPPDESAGAYMEIIPEYLYEFDNYEDAEFEYMSKEEFEEFVSIVPNDDDDLNSIMHDIFSIIWNYCYVAVEPDVPESVINVLNIVNVMKKNSYNVPSIDYFTKYLFDVKGGWGDFIDRKEYLSVE